MAQDPQILEILLRTDLVELIGDSVRLTRSGRSFKGLCPFHTEKTPSFHVYPSDGVKPGFFHCYGCHKGGDALTFLIEKEGFTFLEALEQLAARAGVELKRTRTLSQRKRGNRLELMAVCQGHFRSNLRHPEKGEKARRYLADRKVDSSLIDRFGLGYAVDGWDALGKLFQKDPESLNMALKQGLLKTGDRGGRPYDFFRDRLMFPVYGTSGQLVAFAGRDLSGTSQAKYMNTSEWDLFKKSRVLYGFHLARDSIREKGRAILVEGYFDVIRMHAYGFTETVAPMGTAVTLEQLSLLERLGSELVFLFDGDSAGRTAAARSVQLTWNLKIPVRVAHLPEGQDPDDFLLGHDPEEMEDRIGRAQDAFRYLVNSTVESYGGSTPESMQRVLDTLFESMASMESRLKIDFRLKELAEILHVSLESLKHDWERFRRRKRRNQGPGALGGPGPEQRKTSSAGLKLSPEEEAKKGVLKLLLAPEDALNRAMGASFASHPEVRDLLGEVRETLVDMETSGDAPLAALLQVYLSSGTEKTREYWQENEIDPKLKWEVEAELRDKGAPENPLRTLRDYTHTLKRKKIEKQISDCKHAILLAEKSHEWDRVGRLAERMDALVKERELILSRTLEEEVG